MHAAALIAWYQANARDLPWRRTRDPYRIWVSEIMLQQTRAGTVAPYYERFIERYPDLERLAAADEEELLTLWAGLGYYSRARNLHRAAKSIAHSRSGFPRTYEAIRALPGVGDYTAAAIASIAFGLPYAVLDGNVIRVMARVTNDGGDVRSAATKARLQAAVSARLDPAAAGTFNQAMMELGATVCVPADPKCLICPLSQFCEGRIAGRARELPVKSSVKRRAVEVVLLWVQRDSQVLAWRRPEGSRRLAGFWELPEGRMLPRATVGGTVGEFRHSITNTDYRVVVRTAAVSRKRAPFQWVGTADLERLPFSTMSRKALTAALGRRRGDCDSRGTLRKHTGAS